MRRSLEQIKNEIKSQYFNAMMTMAQTGNTAPMVELITNNTDKLRDQYGIDIQELIGISDEQLAKYKKVKFGATSPPITEVTGEGNKKITASNWIVMSGIVAGFAGIGFIIGAIKNRK
jgi:hypothetical protein